MNRNRKLNFLENQADFEKLVEIIEYQLRNNITCCKCGHNEFELITCLYKRGNDFVTGKCICKRCLMLYDATYEF